MSAGWDLLQPQLGKYGSSNLRIAAARDYVVVLDDGRELLDLNSGYWTCAFGYSAPALVAAAQSAFRTLPYAHLYFRAHRPAVRLAQRLRDLMPVGACERLLFANDGTGASEIALRIVGRRVPHDEPVTIAVVRHGYHGDSLVVRKIGDYRLPDDRPTAAWLNVVYLAPDDVPLAAAIDEARGLFDSQKPHAVFLEVVQSVGGCRVLADDYIRAIAALCASHDVLLVVDEIATGFGRTGAMFGFEHAGITPDLTLLGKAITGGFFPLAAVAAGRRATDLLAGEFVHGHTTTGHPVGCEIALAVLEQLRDGRLISSAAVLGEEVLAELRRSIGDRAVVRGRGLAIGIEIPRGMAKRVRLCLEENDILVGQESNTITIIPPLTMPREVLLPAVRSVAETVRQLV